MSSPAGMLIDPLIPLPCGLFRVASVARVRVSRRASSSLDGIIDLDSPPPWLMAAEVTGDGVIREVVSPLWWVFGTVQCRGVALLTSSPSGMAVVRVDASLTKIPDVAIRYVVGAVGSTSVGGSVLFGRAIVSLSRVARAFNLSLHRNFCGGNRVVQRVTSRRATVTVFLDMFSPLKDVVSPLSPTVRWAGVSPWYHLRGVSPPGGVGVEVSPVAGISSITLVGVVLDSSSRKRLVNCFSMGFGALATVCCELGFANPLAPPKKRVPCSKSAASRYCATGPMLP